MNYNWSLESLYKGYDNTYQNDLKKVDKIIEDMMVVSKKLETKEDLVAFLNLDAEFNTLFRSLFAYANLNLSVNASDSKSHQMYGLLAQKASDLSSVYALFQKFLVENKNHFSQWVEESDYLKEHAFILQEMINQGDYLLNEDIEEVISKMQLNASANWSKLQGHLTSTKQIEFLGEMHTMTSLRNFAYHNDPQVRKAAYKKEIELYKQMDDAVAFALNSIKGEVNTINELRGYKDSLEATLIQSRMERETLDALFKAMEDSYPVFRKYYKHKAKLLGHKGSLPWYDMFAPISHSSKSYTIEEAQQIILDSFYSFSNDLGDLAKRAFEENWVDYLPKEGKRGGAFCSNQPQIKESRIMTNFGGSISDVITLAHELGHAYHGYLIENLSILNTSYTMPVAETASTFCENLVLNHSLKTASKDEQILLLENSISDLAQIVVDISSRFFFEKEVFNQRKETFLFSDDLQKIMIESQKRTYGDGIDETTLHPYMWICKPHYYSSGLSYYNFPYAFGGLFALGLYGKYEEERENFVPKYRKLLQATTTSQSEDVAKIAGINLRDANFWSSSLKIAEDRIDQWIALTSVK